VGYIRDAPGDPDNLWAGLGYYWGQFDPTRFGSPEWAAEQASAWGGSVPQPVLYLHGSNDGCHGMTEEKVKQVKSYCGPGSEAELIEGVGHFLMLEKPGAIAERVTDWLTRTAPAKTPAGQSDGAMAGIA
jgi:pimeloyl-ACP methyl ester carboxylesterase